MKKIDNEEAQNEVKKERNNNVILLTVIALVTMIVVVIGATFAYLASSINDAGNSAINASTNGSSDLFLINMGNALDLVANETNFGKDNTDVTVATNADVKLQTSGDSTFKYDVYLDIYSNDFVYSSGKCYFQSGLTAVTGMDDYATCTGANNVWATTNGTDYSCYTASDSAIQPKYKEQPTCLAANNTWGKEEIAELVFELYKNTDAADEATCKSAGVCVNSSYDIIGSDKTTCDADQTNIWLPNIWDASVNGGTCYNVSKTYDLTKTVASEKISLLTDETITANNGGAATYYKARVTLRNFAHNQMVNSNKNLKASLNIVRKDA